MLQLSQVSLPIDHTNSSLYLAALKMLRTSEADLKSLTIKQRAIDARRGHVHFSYTLLAEVTDETRILQKVDPTAHAQVAVSEAYHPPQLRHEVSERPIIVGSGPCGLFCGLLLARAGMKPVLLERGKAAGERARDVTGFWNRGLAFNAESNVQYGEGGAGTFSDGKLYTQIRDHEHRIPWLLKEMVKAGAPEDILIKARPHIGTDRLIKVVRHVREEIISLGGEVRFGSRVSDVVIERGAMRAVVLADASVVEGSYFIFAIGHSSRDTFEMLKRHDMPMERKPFSIGVRIEHPQKLIDSSLYGRWAGHQRLGSAPYKFVAHCDTGRTAYSFCMCPGGLVVAANSESGTVVTNGMSSYARAESNANAGFMVDVRPEDYPGDDVLAGVELQRSIEKSAFDLAGGTYKAPAQLLGDFMAGRASSGPGKVQPSYKPGVVWTDLTTVLPDYIVQTLTQAVPRIDKSLRGFALEEAVLTGFETRSSCPIRIPRDPETLECKGVRHFYPAGEGAGYAGGIISAAADGMRVAEAVLRQIQKKTQ
ncbi:MAG: NAD(P)/FAD-dependent oxidoreductase [Prosthecobacter sp.]